MRPSSVNKLSLYAGEGMRLILNDTENKSARLETVCQRYAAIVGDNRPILNHSELKAVATVAAGLDLADLRTVNQLWAAVAESKKELGKGINPATLSDKLRSMTVAQRMALAEALESKP